MPKSDRILLNVSQLSRGVTLTGELPVSIFGIDEPGRLKCIAPLSYELNARVVGEGVLVDGVASTKLECKCDRCLEAYEHEIVVDEICHFYEGVEEREIDLTDDIREDLVINFPVKCLCDEECQGLCPQCGQNLNTGACECSGESDAPSVWDKLDGLNL